MTMSKVARLSLIHTEIYHCEKCVLHTQRTHTVPGAGNPHAEIMFIGEAPGYNEDQQGLPFVGKSGQYLEELLKGIQLSRRDVFIANVVKCRPPDNRDPFASEIETCNPYLRAQIEVIDPLVIATLGRFSMNMFFPNEKISQIHGQPRFGTRRAYYPFYHPAAALRNANLKSDMVADFSRLLDVVAEVRARRASGEMAAHPEPDTAVNPAAVVPDEEQDDDAPTQMGLFES